MKKIILISFLLSGNIAFANGSSFKGFTNLKNAFVEKFHGRIDLFQESEDEFFILFENHAALYRFPKREGSSLFRSFLRDRMMNRKKIRAEIDSNTTQILLMKD